MPKGMFDKETELLQKFKKKDIREQEDYKRWREHWRIEGPVKFAYQVLRTDPNTGGPLVLSDGQKEFLEDLAFHGVRLVIISAGRGSGKTFVLAIYIMWRIFTHDLYSITCMGGSQEQSDKIAADIRGWITNNQTLTNYTLKNIEKITRTYSEGEAKFHACSGTSVRGPHTYDLIIDEQAAGEEKGGEKFIRAAIWDVSTSPDIHVIQSSTAHFIHGDFLKTWNDAEKLGYKKYQWAIARHINGETDPYKIYEDTNPKHWKSNVPWIPDKNIEILRIKEGNDEWLVEALGGISMSSGLVLNPADFGVAICKAACDECHPYQDPYCLEFVQRVLMYEGTRIEDLPKSTVEAVQDHIHNRVMGIDWGRGSPTAYVVLGQFKEWVFVLEAHEIIGWTDQEKLDFAVELANKWQVEVIRPDPREWALNGWLSERVQAGVHELFTGAEGGNEKYKYVAALKKFVERHKLCIPRHQDNDDLIRSLRNLAYDENGKIRKQDDHSADAMIYAISYYDEIDNGEVGGVSTQVLGGANLW
jgi:hypothetical protein